MTVDRTLLRLPLFLTAGILAAGTLAACSSPSSRPSTTTNAAHSQTSPLSQPSGTASLTATETEFHIALSSTSLKAGTVTFHVTNSGSITHALTVDGSGVDKSTGDISPGSSATLTVTLKAGSYDVFCPVGNHKAEGMNETVQVS